MCECVSTHMNTHILYIDTHIDHISFAYKVTITGCFYFIPTANGVLINVKVCMSV